MLKVANRDAAATIGNDYVEEGGRTLVLTQNTPFKKFAPIDSPTDDASQNVPGQTYQPQESTVVRTAATGTYLDANGKSASNSASVIVRIPQGGAAGVIAAADPITVTELAALEIVEGVKSQGIVGYGTTLPAANATQFEIFHLSGQTDAQFNGVYQRVGVSHWFQSLSATGGNAFQSISVGDTLPNAAATTVSAHLLTRQTPSTLNGFYERYPTHWVQIIQGD